MVQLRAGSETDLQSTGSIGPASSSRRKWLGYWGLRGQEEGCNDLVHAPLHLTLDLLAKSAMMGGCLSSVGDPDALLLRPQRKADIYLKKFYIHTQTKEAHVLRTRILIGLTTM